MFYTYDDYLSQYIGFGKYQYVQFLIISLSEMSRGISEILIPILTLQFKFQWTISAVEQSIMNFLFPGCAIIGIVLSAFYSDKIGRNRMITISYSGFAFIYTMFVFVDNMIEVIICIGALGILQGMTVPIGLSLISEMIPSEIRGKALVTFYFMQFIGFVYTMIMCQIFLDSYQEGNWRGLIISLIPLFTVAAILSALYGSNSSRLLLYQGKFSQAFELLENMGKENHGDDFPKLHSTDKDILIKWTQRMRRQLRIKKIKFVDLFKKKKENKIYTLYLIVIYVGFGLVSQGYLIIFPYLYLKRGSSFYIQLIAYSGDILGFIINFMIIDDENYGRKKTTAYCLIMLIFIQMLNIFIQDYQLTLGLAGIRTCLRIIQPTIGIMILESYSTPYRSLGVGSLQAFFRISNAVSSFVTIFLYEYSHQLLYLVWICLSLMTSYFTYHYPIDRTKIQLDEQVTTIKSMSIPDDQDFVRV